MALNFNQAHVQSGGAYHYHSAPLGLVKALDKREDLVLAGFAMEGFSMKVIGFYP